MAGRAPHPVHTDDAPAAIGPYSQAIVVDGWVYCSGQIGIDPATGALVSSDVADQTRQVLANLAAVLEAAGSSLDQVVKTTVYLDAMASFPLVNEIYAEAFGQTRPARATVAVSELPKQAQVEIDAVARIS